MISSHNIQEESGVKENTATAMQRKGLLRAAGAVALPDESCDLSFPAVLSPINQLFNQSLNYSISQ